MGSDMRSRLSSMARRFQGANRGGAASEQYSQFNQGAGSGDFWTEEQDEFGGEAVEMGSTSLMQSSDNSTGRRPGAGPGSSPNSDGISGLETVQL